MGEINQIPGPLQNLSFTINSSLSHKAQHLKASQTLMGTRSAAPQAWEGRAGHGGTFQKEVSGRPTLTGGSRTSAPQGWRP